MRSTSLLHRQSVQNNYENQDHRVSTLSTLSLDNRTPHKTRLSSISAQSCYSRVLTVLATVQINYKAFRQKYCFLGSMFFMKCDKLIQKTKDGLASKVPFYLALGQRSSGNSHFCYPPRRKKASEHFFCSEHMNTITRCSAVPNFTVKLSSEASSPHRDFLGCE